MRCFSSSSYEKNIPKVLNLISRFAIANPNQNLHVISPKIVFLKKKCSTIFEEMSERNLRVSYKTRKGRNFFSTTIIIVFLRFSNSPKVDIDRKTVVKLFYYSQNDNRSGIKNQIYLLTYMISKSLVSELMLQNFLLENLVTEHCICY